MTVRRWIKAGRIQVVQVGREMRIPRSEIERMVGASDERLLVLYGRVSGHGQKDDLETQLERLQTWARTERKGQETLVLSNSGRFTPLLSVKNRIISGFSHNTPRIVSIICQYYALLAMLLRG
jgi:hypothetical protein